MQVVSAAGAVDHSQLVQLAEKAFSGLPAEGLSSKEYIDKASSLPASSPSAICSPWHRLETISDHVLFQKEDLTRTASAHLSVSGFSACHAMSLA